MRKSNHHYIRKAHRYLGVFLGIQFFFGLWGWYCSWSNIDMIHEDHLVNEKQVITIPDVIVALADTMNGKQQILKIKIAEGLEETILQGKII